MSTFTKNSKTILSVDFDRSTCSQRCPYCYVNTTERIYKAYADKIKVNTQLAKETPEIFAENLNREYSKLRNSKSKTMKRLHILPIRIYGSGDYVSEHYEFLKHLNFNFFVISKSLTQKHMLEEITKLTDLTHLNSLVLSFDSVNINNYTNMHDPIIVGNKKIKFSFTGMPEEYKRCTGLLFNSSPVHFNIFFNISDKNIYKEESKSILSACPCDAGKLAHNESCSYCNKCWK